MYKIKHNFCITMLNYRFRASYEIKHSSNVFEYYLKTKSVAIINNSIFIVVYILIHSI